jgi:hypothetical protein
MEIIIPPFSLLGIYFPSIPSVRRRINCPTLKMDEISFKMILPLVREKDCSKAGRPFIKIVLKSKRNIN